MSPVTILVMYHYVREPSPAWKGIVPLRPDDFERQLDVMEEVGEIVTPGSLLTPGAGSAPVRFVLTFDDGTKDHYTEVFPRLRRRGLAGLFAAVSAPSLEGHVPTFHLVHAVLSQLSLESLWTELKRTFGEKSLGSAERAALTYPREMTEVRQRTKYALNYALPPEDVREWLLRLFADTCGSLDAFRDTWYLGREEIRTMAAEGMEFAVHGHRHEPWSEDVERFIEQEIDPCREWLGSLLGHPCRQYILPFGGKSAREVDLRRAEAPLRARGIQCAHLSEAGINQDGSFWLRRFDCADLPPRQPWPVSIAKLVTLY